MSAIARNQVFSAVHTVGGLLPADMLVRISEGKDVSGCKPADYRIAGSRSVRDEAERHWAYLRSLWTELRETLPAAPEDDLPADPTRSASTHWLAPLFDTLGFGVLTAIGASGVTSDDGSKTFPISHRWNHVPVHLTAWNADLDKRPGGAGSVPPQSLVQECLNRTDAHLWGMVTNGRQLRLLRDSSALATASYVEFDLEAIFDGELFSEFVLLYRLLHVSRFATAENAAPSTCWLEKWRVDAIASGTRALDQLRDGVQKAITILGTGFLRHPDNTALREDVDVAALHQALLRLVYRMLFAFVAEDRDALHHPDADGQARARYATYFSTAKLRAHARRRRGTGHHDLYESLQVVLNALGDVNGRPELGLPGLGGIFDPTPADEPLRNLRLSNDHLLTAVRHLSQVYDTDAKRWRAVDYQHLDAEELGSIYESLLELIPRHSAVDLEFELVTAAGNARKTTGSYYTPSSLIELLLDSALDPVIDDAVKRGELKATAAGIPDPAESIAGELLSLTVCDPACGSGHFLVAAARRIAKRVAAVREGNPEPTLPAVRTALHEVIARCVYGVDLNPMAVELAKVSLWLEALEPGKPLSFLDAHVHCGNALVGATPKLLRDGIPDAAFKPIEGDDRAWASALARQNAQERDGQLGMFDLDTEVKVANAAFATGLRRITAAPAGTLAEVRKQEAEYRDFVDSAEYARARHVANAWCAAFFWRKTVDAPAAPTEEVFRNLQNPDVDAASERTHYEIDRLARQHRFFHWHLEFPEVFAVPEGADGDPGSGWVGGFSCVVGNPPWDRVKIQDKEFFGAHGREDIVNAKTAAIRGKMIRALADDGDPLHDAYLDALRTSDGISHLLRNSGRYPLTGQGDINTYSVFAETIRTIIAADGTGGIITPTGIATDKTTAPFFADTLGSKRLLAFYDFENEAKIFPGVDHRVRFAITALSGTDWVADKTRFAFLTRHVEDVPERQFELAADEVLAINPNTGTLPMFRTRTDAEITLDIYRRHPVLVRDTGDGRNLWGLSFTRLFDMANDSGLFHQPDDLADAHFDGWSCHRGDAEFLPLYEAKLLGHFDHRFSTYRDATQAQLNVGSLPRPTDTQHDDPDMEPLARYWVARSEVRKQLATRWDRDWLLGWRDIARTSDMRTFVPSVFPTAAVGDPFLLALPTRPDHGPLLHAVWSSLGFDYVARQKLSGTHMKYFTVKQLACPIPATFAEPAPWQPSMSLAKWVIPYVLELSYTSWRLLPYANEMGDNGPPFRWNPERRALLRADLDAAFLHVYGLTRPEAEHVLDSFFVVRKYEERDFGEYRTKRLVLDAYDRMSAAIEGTVPWTPLAAIPAGDGPRHPARA
ncbi:N-6 DNA methylase [Pseudonocardia hierapolitana]|uniref:site-specific DNA-methyltransferase (adenine-specific) n=1 Tax=Pseudonocardia hierapolitana TaxID=1128676 RepID=A0A561SL87_9PSEU|nr:DNA methyltransferase [Pseudonocardia hierapolitana]TWF75631.1 N-6 DNA methylase [Pseudonocardia hierapolitana]